MGGVALTVLTDANFEAEVLRSEVPVVVDFSATWCGPCKQLVPVLEKAAEEFAGRAKFGKVDVDGNRQTAMTYMIRSVPTILIFKGGTVAQQSVGPINGKKLKEMLEKVL